PLYRNGNAPAEPDFDLLGFIGRVLWGLRPLPGGFQRRIGRIFEFSAFMTHVQQVAVATMDLCAAGSDGDSPAFGIGEAIFARLQVPLPPGSDHLELRRERLICMFEAHLIVAFAGASVRNRG